MLSRDGQSRSSSRGGVPTKDSAPGRSRFHRESVALLIGLLVAASTYAFLISNAGWLFFADKETARDLTQKARGDIRRDNGSLVLHGTKSSSSDVHLGSLRISPKALYLVEVRAGPGSQFVLTARHPSWDKQVVFKYRKRDAPRTYLRILAMEDVRRRIRFRLRYRGPGDLHIESLKIYKVSSARRRLVVLLPALMVLATALYGIRHRRRLIRSLRVPQPASDALFALAVFAGCFLAFYRADVRQIIDSRYITVVSHSLLRTGSLAVPENFDWGARNRKPYQLRRVHSRFHHYFSSAPAVLNTPFVGAYELLGVAPVARSGAYIARNEHRILKFTAAFLAAVLCVCFYALARLYLVPIHALPLVFLFAFGTQIFSTLSRPYWSHTWAVLLTTAALYLVLRPPRNAARTAELVAAATLLAWSYFCRPTMSLSVLGVSLLVALRQRKRLGIFIGAGLIWGGLFIAYSLSTYDSVLPPYFGTAHLASRRFSLRLVRTMFPDALLGTLVSPSRGLFVYVPFFAWILAVTLRRWRLFEPKALAPTALTVIVAHWLLVSSFKNWWGGQSFGPRLFADIVPWFFVLGILTIKTVVAEDHGQSHRRRIGRFAVIGVLAAASLFINFRGATARATYHWNSWDRPPARKIILRPRFLWNWRYPQFLAGLLPPDKDKPKAKPPSAAPVDC